MPRARPRDLGIVTGTLPPSSLHMLSPDAMNPLLRAAAEATEEAILNALCAAETMIGVHGHTAHARPLDAVVEVTQRYRPRPAEPPRGIHLTVTMPRP